MEKWCDLSAVIPVQSITWSGSGKNELPRLARMGQNRYQAVRIINFIRKVKVMVPLSVSRAWKELPEKKKSVICRLCAKNQPLIFDRWTTAAGVKNFRHESLVNRKAGSAARLDATLFKAENGHLAADLLIAYFTAMAPEINSQYLEMLENSENEEAETKLNIYAQLVNSYADSPFIDLYLATALWIEEFDEKEIETVKQLAVQFAACAGE
ncbi:MAG: hypothetical protein U9R29_05890 [Thermodesulfobacteriota bacterium]|nr:hypothetical protein [Thermodesulfobacteriota bacterium]